MSTSLRVLNVEDQERDVALLRRHLSRAGYEVISERVETPETMRAALETQWWDVILCDYSMPKFSALAALELLKKTGLDLPFIIISGTIGEEVAVQAMLHGAHDYLMKDNLARLVPAIERELEEAKNRRLRRQTEEKLRQSERQLAEAQHIAHIGSWNWDLQNNILTWSHEHYHIFGLDPQKFDLSYEAAVEEFIHPDDRALVRERVENSIKANESFGFDYRIIRLDGDERIIHSRGNIVTDEQGRPIRMFGTAQDVTERRRAEEAQVRLTTQLESQRQRLNTIIANIPGLVWESWGEPGIVTQGTDFVSDYVETMLGYSVEEWLSTPNKWLTIVHPDDKERAASEVAAHYASGKGGALEFRWITRDGRVVWVETQYVIICDNNDNPLGLRGVTIDITERKQAEELHYRRASHIALRAEIRTILAERESDLQKILQRCTAAIVRHLGVVLARIWTLNEEENILELQANAEVHTPLSGSQARIPAGEFKIGFIAEARHPYITNDVQDDPRISNKEWIRQEGISAFAGYPLIVENRLLGVIAVFARQILTEDTIDALASVSDIISQGILRKHTEEALRQSEDQLRQSQKLESIGQLAGGIAHDFNNLLTVINGYSELSLKRLQPADPIYRNLKEVKNAGERATALTRQLLAFSRKQVLQPKVLDINTVISNFEKMLQRLIGEDIELKTMLESNLGSVKADPGQIEQVIMNLVVNARDAMPKGGKLTIETNNIYLDENYASQHVSVSPGHYVMLAVSDTGIGMNEETRKRIFEPFFTTKGLGEGTGLGLSTVYGIVKQSGGNVWVYSEPGHGTTFKIYLPRVDEDPQDYEQSTEAEEKVQGTETILLAEDEEMVRNLACEVLESYGYQVLEAATGSSALSICESYPEQIHLLITDVIMPEMSGRELAERLLHLRPETKVLYMSGYTDNAIVHHGVLDEATNFIQKPFAPDALARKVREILDASGF